MPNKNFAAVVLVVLALVDLPVVELVAFDVFAGGGGLPVYV